MCMDSGKKEAKRAAQKAEQEEADRQRKIEEGKKYIEEAFYPIEGKPIYEKPQTTYPANFSFPFMGFNPTIPFPQPEQKIVGRTDTGFYDDAKNSYLDYYLPQLDKQYGDYNERNIYTLADKGLLQSSVKGEVDSDLADQYQIGQDKIYSGAADYEKGIRGDVANTKSDLMSLVLAGVDPASVSNMANTRAGILARPNSFDPLGDVFSQLATQAQNRFIAKKEGYPSKTGSLLFNSNPSSNNVKVVG